MTLKDAIGTGFAIRTPEMGLQMLVPEETSDGIRFRLSGTFNPVHQFTDFDNRRDDWEPVTPAPLADSKNPALEAEFSEPQGAPAKKRSVKAKESGHTDDGLAD